jgi:NitT/TauT family transport system substrate-binding protein
MTMAWLRRHLRYDRLFLALAAMAGLQATASGQTTKIVQVGIPGDAVPFAPWFIARRGGFFEKNGLDVRFVFLAGNALPAALQSHGIQATPMLGEIVFGNLAGFKVRPVAVLEAKAPYMIVAKDSIKTIQDLRGKVIATSPPVGTPNALLYYHLTKNGIDPKKDVKLLYVGSESARRTLVLTGEADAIIEDAKGGFELEEKMPSLHTLVPPSEMPPQTSAGFSTSEDLIKSDPDMLKQIMRALAQADDFTKANPDKAAVMLGEDLKMSLSVSKQAIAVLISAFSNSLVPTDDLYEGQAKISSIFGDKTVSAVTLKGIWDTSLAQQVDSERAGK